MRSITNRRSRAQPSQSATARPSASTTPNLRVNIWSLRVLAMIGGMMSGYSQPFISGLINMPVFVLSLSRSAYSKSNLAPTSNFCKFTNSLVLWMHLFVPIGTMVGLALGKRLRGLNLIIGPVLVVVGAAVCAHIPRLVVHGVMYFMTGLGIGIIREVIPIWLLQIAPEGERHGLDLLFDLFSLLGGVLGPLINFIVFKYFPKFWWVGFYGLVCFAFLILLASIRMGIWGNESPISSQPQRDIVTIKLEMALLPDFIVLDQLVFFAPSVLESFGVWEGNTFVIVLIGGLVVFLVNCISTPILIPRFGRRWVLCFACAIMFLFQCVMILVSRVSMTTQNHLQSPFTIIAGISFLVIYAMHGIVSGPHGWTSIAYPREMERAWRARELVLRLYIQVFITSMIAPLICGLQKWIFVYMAVVALLYFVSSLVIVRR